MTSLGPGLVYETLMASTIGLDLVFQYQSRQSVAVVIGFTHDKVNPIVYLKVLEVSFVVVFFFILLLLLTFT